MVQPNCAVVALEVDEISIPKATAFAIDGKVEDVFSCSDSLKVREV